MSAAIDVFLRQLLAIFGIFLGLVVVFVVALPVLILTVRYAEWLIDRLTGGRKR